MNEYINTSDQVDALFAALATAQYQMGSATKDSTNPHFRSRYASLAAVLEAVVPALNKQGISLLQHPGYSAGVVSVTTVLAHKTGQWMSSTASAPAKKDDPQGVGSAITYLRRYAAQSILGLPVEDDDGNAASGSRGQRSASAGLSRAQRDEVAARQERESMARLGAVLSAKSLRPEDVDRWCLAHSRPEIMAMGAHRRNQLTAWLEAGPGAQQISAWIEARALENGDDSDVAVPTVESK